MKKIDYLKLAINNPIHNSRAWITSVFAITKPGALNPSGVAYLQLVKEEWGYSFYGEDAVLVKIDDADPKLPLFTFKERLNIDNTWLPNVYDPVETSIGNVLFNSYCLVSSFGKKFKYVTGPINVGKLEAEIAPKLQDTPTDESKRSDQYFYVDELIKFIDSLQFLSTLSQLVSWAATRIGITAPPGIKEFKEKLLVKYEGKLNNPVELTKFENELRAYDDAYLKQDPAYGTYMGGKIKDVGRKKMFLSLGADPGFTESLEVKPVIQSLEEGWSRDPQDITNIMNGVRWGSYARGAETIKGGVSAKLMLRAANNFTIEDRDCGSTLGIHRNFEDKDANQLVGRYILQGTKSVLIENITSSTNYLNKDIIVRSPMYCKLEGDRLCKLCAGHKLFKFATGVAIPVSEISNILLYTSMAAMHATTLSTAKINLSKALT